MTLLVPIALAERKLSDYIPRSISMRVQVKNEVPLEAATRELTESLRRIHRVGLKEPDDFSVVAQTDIVKRAQAARATGRRTFFLAMSWALVLGAVLIANALSASIAERTSEIGLCRAVGATRGAIALQFLTEGVLIAVAGCAAGAVLGAGAGAAFGLWLEVTPRMDLPFAAAVIIANLVLAFTGSLFPALRAGCMSPLQALNHP
jgi:putative ABC transport system permease protein